MFPLSGGRKIYLSQLKRYVRLHREVIIILDERRFSFRDRIRGIRLVASHSTRYNNVYPPILPIGNFTFLLLRLSRFHGSLMNEDRLSKIK